MVTFTVNAPAEMVVKLNKIKEEKDISRSEIVTEAIAEWLTNHKEEIKKTIEEIEKE